MRQSLAIVDIIETKQLNDLGTPLLPCTNRISSSNGEETEYRTPLMLPGYPNSKHVAGSGDLKARSIRLPTRQSICDPHVSS